MCMGCIVLSSGCAFGTAAHEEKFLPTLQQGHVAHPCRCSQGGLGDRGDLEDREDQQVQPGLGHPEEKKTQQKRRIKERNTKIDVSISHKMQNLIF